MTSESDAVSDEELTEYVNDAYAELYDLIVDADDARLFAKNAGLLLDVGEKSYLLPEDLYRLVGVHAKIDSQYRSCERADSSEYASLALQRHEPQFWHRSPRYYFRWDLSTGQKSLFLLPEKVGDVAVVYIPQPRVFVDDDDRVDNPAQWMKFVEVTAAISMLDKVEREATALLIQKKNIGQRIEDAVNDIDQHSGAKIRDVTSRQNAFGGSL